LGSFVGVGGKGGGDEEKEGDVNSSRKDELPLE
jgi:hypothetical protein